MQEDITKEPTVNIIKEMTHLENQINIQILKYEKLKAEIIRRFPMIEECDELKLKIKTK